jgi:hypothetical protein
VSAALLSALLGAVAKFLLDLISDRKADAALKQSGAAEQAAATARESADANRKAADVALNARRGTDLDRDLESGDRGF